MHIRPAMLASAILATPGLWLCGCALVRAPTPVSIESDQPLPRRTTRDLILLASVQDEIRENGVNEELVRLATRADENNVVSFFRAKGYFDASVTSALVERRERPHVIFSIRPGPVYQIQDFTFVWPEDYRGPQPTNGTPTGAAVSRVILSARNDLIRFLREHGHPNAKVIQQAIVVDHATREVRATFEVLPGSRARFGNLRVEGLRDLRPTYIYRSGVWRGGDLYDIRKVELMERQLASSGLFSSILTRRDPVAPPHTEPGGDEVVDITVSLRERRPRTIQAGIGYRTDTGAEASAQWQHRNLFGGGETFLAKAKINQQGYEAETRVTVPFFLRPDQQWVTLLRYRDEEPDAYASRAMEAGTWISRQVTRHLLVRTGAGLQYLDETQNQTNQNYFLALLPQELSWDRSNDKMDATRGYRVIWQTSPYQNLNDTSLFFWKNLVSVNGFVPLRKNDDLLVAVRLTTGSISGDDLRNIPAETRFYAGGGQSVRGYEYQSLSPRSGDSIIGGMSLLESSLEIRGRLGSSIGLVAFLDGGSAYENRLADFEETYRWGTGLGFRYFTPVGPLRFDVGFPLNRREGIDDAAQFYISIGQSF